MRQLASFDELFQFIRSLIEQLKNAGHADAAMTLREGYAALNKAMWPELRAQLAELQAVIRKMVYR